MPLLLGKIDAGGVMAARVQHHDRAGGETLEGGTHAGEIEPVGVRVVVRIALHGKARGLEELAVVFPARLADPDRRVGVDALQEVGADPQPAGAAQRLNGHDIFFLGTENKFLHGLVVDPQTVDRQVASVRHALQPLAFRVAHALEERNLPAVVVVDADAEVYFSRILVGDERLGYAEDRVARRHRQRGEGGRGVGSVHADKMIGSPFEIVHCILS